MLTDDVSTVKSSLRKHATNGHYNEDLRLERDRSKLNIERLTNMIDGGERATEKRRQLGELCALP